MNPPKNTIGMQQLMTGVYFDGKLVHVYPEILCEQAGLQRTPANIELVAVAVTKRLVEVFGVGARGLNIVSEKQPEHGAN